VDKKDLFLAAIKTNEGAIFKIASVYTDDVADRDDLIQEIILQLWKSFDTFQQKASLSTWIYRVALNVALYQLKTAKRRVPTVSLNDKVHFTSEFPLMEEDAPWKLLKTHIDQLNLLEKGLVILYLEEKSYEEIGAIVGISTSNVGTKLSRIKEKLRQQVLKQTF
jgi:RNA polymerase sigma-70 factor (ECF subfamily)